MEMVKMTNGIVETLVPPANVAELQKSGYKVVETPTAPATNSGNGKSLSREERKQLRERNLSNSLVIPSAIADAVKAGILAELTVTFVKFFKKKSGRTGSEYVAAQIDVIIPQLQNKKFTFCVLDDPENAAYEVGQQAVFNCLTTEDPAIRSGVVLELQK